MDEAIAQVEEIAEASSSAYVHASALGRTRPPACAARGEFEEARALVEETRRRSRSSACGESAAAHSIAVGEVELMAGDDAAAERVLRDRLRGADRAPTTSTRQANVAWRLGLAAGAARAKTTRRSASRASRSDVPTPGLWVDVWWRVVLALVEATPRRLRRVRCGSSREARAGMASAAARAACRPTP